MRVMKLNERLTKVRCANDKLRARISTAFTNLKNETARKTYETRPETDFEAFDDFFK